MTTKARAAARPISCLRASAAPPVCGSPADLVAVVGPSRGDSHSHAGAAARSAEWWTAPPSLLPSPLLPLRSWPELCSRFHVGVHLSVCQQSPAEVPSIASTARVVLSHIARSQLGLTHWGLLDRFRLVGCQDRNGLPDRSLELHDDLFVYPDSAGPDRDTFVDL